MPGYAELHALSNFSFQRGASHAGELIRRAIELGYEAIAITDECSLAGIVRAHEAANRNEDARGRIKLIVGAEFRFDDGLKLVLLAPHLRAYQQLSALITRGRMAAAKGRYRLRRDDAAALAPDCLALLIPDEATGAAEARWLRSAFRDAWIAVELHRDGRDAATLARLRTLAAATGLRCAACGDVRYHARERRALHDVMTALAHRLPVAECGARLLANGERHLRSLAELGELYPDALLDEAAAIARRCNFSMDEVKYQYPRELVPERHTPTTWLRALSLAGLREHWPGGAPFRVRRQIATELALIAELGYEPFFLTVHDIVRKARELGILCQGRGSAANSAVCFALGITAVNPGHHRLLFGRFLSKERAEPPDIDVDFEHQRREEIIQYVFEKYGRARAAIAATVITYRSRSALRDVGRALGVAPEEIDRLAKSLAWWDKPDTLPQRLRALGFDPERRQLKLWMHLTRTLIGMPRHLSQHVGGFVISDGPLSELVPTETAAMDGRSIIQWDKDDLEALGLLKVDVLALGMLSAIRRALELRDRYDDIQRSAGEAMRAIPHEDGATYAMIQRGETLGVFQIESRAQMNMVTRLKPAKFYDLAVQVAIVRPGPIQGGMVHPYLRNRRIVERGGRITYPPRLEGVLKRTLGVPIFQEQVMEIAILAADFSPGEADQMRRSMAAWKRSGGLEKFEARLKAGMRKNGYADEFAERIFQQILGFGSYGFPESHAISFALLAYVSSWLKCHAPAAFFAGLLNAWPMGFYPPSMLVREAQRLRVEVRAVKVTQSAWECTLEASDQPARRGAGQRTAPAIRLGLSQIRGLSEDAAQRIVAARSAAPLRDLADLAARAALSERELARLADADALSSLVGHRHVARWAAAGARPPPGLLREAAAQETLPLLAAPTEGAEIIDDYRATGITLRRHPLALLRRRLAKEGTVRARDLLRLPDRQPVRVAGLVMFRQRPQTASGLTFMTLEDETGVINLIVPAKLMEAERDTLIGTTFLIADGELQNRAAAGAGEIAAPGNVHVLLHHAETRNWLDRLPYLSRDFQ